MYILLVICIVGWSDLALFATVKSGHIAANQVYFQEFNSKKVLPRERAAQWWQSFNFLKITGTLKMNIFLKICNYNLFTFKNNCKKENYKLQIFKRLFKPTKWAKNLESFLHFSPLKN